MATSDECVRIYVSGDRAQVGKSSVSLGIIGSLLRAGMSTADIAYFKPATQCTKSQAVARFCERHEIASEPMGPVVFYSGFTREVLDGAETPLSLRAKVRAKLSELSKGKKVVVVDGVGYPAVGSVCGISNADVARELNCAVVMVGRKGVGDAVDSFNLNATYMEGNGARVIGAVFNRLPLEGFYSLDSCKNYVTKYFDACQASKRLYGFIPDLEDVLPAVVAQREGEEVPLEEQLAADVARADVWVKHFGEHVNVQQLVDDARRVCAELGPPAP